MPAPSSAKQIAKYQRDGFLFPSGCLTPNEVRHHRGCRAALGREQGVAFGRSEYGNIDRQLWRAWALIPPRAPGMPPWGGSFDSNKVLTVRWRSGNVRI